VRPADVVVYLLRLAVLDVDLEAAVEAKLQVNAQKYPIALAHGNATNTRRKDS
jgi:dCTP diphosphatase